MRSLLSLGSLKLPSPFIYAPLAGCSDFPFRQMVRRRHDGLIYCEMVKMEPLLRGDPRTYAYLDYSEDMHPIGAQICGSDPELAGPSATIIEKLGFDIIDLNCGCPVDKVTKDGSGSALLRDPERLTAIV
ncbi:MAG: tRNA-dihydrouridine synthase, partial [Chlamydiota bacterium]|nr:tRNA-dihydrouridine synthase [Chlamydiota bacterium]